MESGQGRHCGQTKHNYKNKQKAALLVQVQREYHQGITAWIFSTHPAAAWVGCGTGCGTVSQVHALPRCCVTAEQVLDLVQEGQMICGPLVFLDKLLCACHVPPALCSDMQDTT